MDYTLLVAAHPLNPIHSRMTADEEQRYYESAERWLWLQTVLRVMRRLAASLVIKRPVRNHYYDLKPSHVS